MPDSGARQREGALSPVRGHRGLGSLDFSVHLSLMFVLALFHPYRATALEGLGDLKSALRDYRDLHRANPGVGNAAEAVARIEKALGIAPSPAAAPSRKLQLTEEEARNLVEVQARCKDTARQRIRAVEQMRAAQREKRHVELTMSQLGQVPSTSAVFKPAGRAYIKSNHEDLGASLQDRLAKLSQRSKVCESAAEYLEKQAQEAELAQSEMLRALELRSASRH
jgi:chaperonin cofactor prefoldin